MPFLKKTQFAVQGFSQDTLDNVKLKICVWVYRDLHADEVWKAKGKIFINTLGLNKFA